MLIAIAVILALVCALAAHLLLALLRRRAARWGLLDHPGGRKVHPVAIPSIGGLAILGAVFAVAAGGLAAAWAPAGWTAFLPDELKTHFPGMRARSPQLLALFGGCALLCGLGFVDDRRGLSPWFRLAVQLGAAALLVGSGIQLTLYLQLPALQIALSVLFVVFLTNAINFIDNTDGLMPGATLLIATHLGTLAASDGQLFLAATAIALFAATAAFLPRNYPRAHAFMGDAGTLAIGFFAAGLSLLFTFDPEGTGARALVLPPLLLALPAADGVVVVLTRLARGVHPFTAGRDHLSHRLMALGLTPRGAVEGLWLFCWAGGSGALLLADVPPVGLVPSAVVLTLLLGAGRGPRRRPPANPASA